MAPKKTGNKSGKTENKGNVPENKTEKIPDNKTKALSEDKEESIAENVAKVLIETVADKVVQKDGENDVFVKLNNLKQQLNDIITVSSNFVDSGLSNIAIEDFVVACKQVKAQIDKLEKSENTLCCLPETGLSQFTHECGNSKSDFRYGCNTNIIRQMVSSSPYPKTKVRDKEIPRYMKRVIGSKCAKKTDIPAYMREVIDKNSELKSTIFKDLPPVRANAKEVAVKPSAWDDLINHVINVVKMAKDYQDEGLLCHSVTKFIKSCESLRNKLNYTKDTSQIDYLKDKVVKVGKITSFANSGLKSTSGNHFLECFEGIKENLEVFKTITTKESSHSCDSYNKLVNQIGATLALSKMAKEVGLMPDSMRNFINTCENALQSLQGNKTKAEEGFDELELLHILCFNLNNIIANIGKYKDKKIMTPSIHTFLRTCEDIRNKVYREKLYPYGNCGPSFVEVLCTGNCQICNSGIKNTTVNNQVLGCQICQSKKDLPVQNVPSSCISCRSKKSVPPLKTMSMCKTCKQEVNTTLFPSVSACHHTGNMIHTELEQLLCKTCQKRVNTPILPSTSICRSCQQGKNTNSMLICKSCQQKPKSTTESPFSSMCKQSKNVESIASIATRNTCQPNEKKYIQTYQPEIITSSSRIPGMCQTCQQKQNISSYLPEIIRPPSNALSKCDACQQNQNIKTYLPQIITSVSEIPRMCETCQQRNIPTYQPVMVTAPSKIVSMCKVPLQPKPVTTSSTPKKTTSVSSCRMCRQNPTHKPGLVSKTSSKGSICTSCRQRSLGPISCKTSQKKKLPVPVNVPIIDHGNETCITCYRQPSPVPSCGSHKLELKHSTISETRKQVDITHAVNKIGASNKPSQTYCKHIHSDMNKGKSEQWCSQTNTVSSDRKIGYYEKNLKKTVTVHRFKDKDGNIKEEKTTVNIRKQIFDANRTIIDDEFEFGSNRDIDSFSQKSNNQVLASCFMTDVGNVKTSRVIKSEETMRFSDLSTPILRHSLSDFPFSINN